VDAARRRLFIAHLGAGRVLFFDLARRRVSAMIGGLSGAHGVLVVPSLRRLYVAATGSRQLVTLDEQNGRVLARAPAGTYPDGVAYDSRDRLVFVSDEAGNQVTVFTRSGRRTGAVKLGGDAGNVQYDGPSRRILVVVGSQNAIAAIDPRTRKIVRAVALPGCDHAHGLHLDGARRLAFVACDKNATLLVVDLRTMQVTDTQSVGNRPDVLDLDAGLRRLYVAAESGVVSVFAEAGTTLQKVGQAKLADNAHSVAVDPRTHFVYFPLENVNGKPVLRIMRPS
jgi:DNA-binding beta-propeller fold protein YncE